MRALVLLLICGCATTQATTPATGSCEERCKPALEMCTAQCAMYDQPGSMDRNAGMNAANCRQNCWSRDEGCQRNCAERIKRE
jgi:hypothetical protein